MSFIFCLFSQHFFAQGTSKNELLEYLKKQPFNETIRPFTTDLCTVSPQSWLPFTNKEGWAHCCIEHDIAHWAGGTQKERKASDVRLRQCVKKIGGSFIALVYYSVVRRFGHPYMVVDAPLESPRHSPWGYGWSYYIGHDSLIENQKDSVCHNFENWKQTEDFQSFLETYQHCQGEDPILPPCGVQ